MTDRAKRIIIFGAGPCGLGAAWRLHELGYHNWTLFEKSNKAGGLAASFRDDFGFTWDIGGHVQFSHYDYFDKVMLKAHSEEEWLLHERESWVWMQSRFIPYPFQLNIGLLPQREMMECLQGLMNCPEGPSNPSHFGEWIDLKFGVGIRKHFLEPYNFKVWAYPLEDLNATWMGERVAVPNIERVIGNIISGKLDCSWGPNNQFRFPLRGGTGSIWTNIASQLPSHKVIFGHELQALDLEKKRATLAGGHSEDFDALISTIPLDDLLRRTSPDIDVSPREFAFSSSNIFGIGMRGAPPVNLRTKCWMYFPEINTPFYRVTVFSNYSANNVPGPGHWSLMAEVSESPKKPVDHDTIQEEVVDGLVKAQLIPDTSDIVSIWRYRANKGYPTPFLQRDEILKKVLHALRLHDVYSRGRFGAWKYEVSNQDHAFMQGVEAVDNALFGTPELTLNYPDFVNSNRTR